MTTDEAINHIECIIKWDSLEINNNALEMAIKALKQYGALQEIRQEIEKSRITQNISTTEKMWWNAAIENVLEIMDKHIKEIEE